MKLELITPQERYKVESHPETPYLRAKEEWDKRLGTLVAQARSWRVTCLLSLLLSFVLLLGLLYLASLSKVVPMVIAIDRERGEPKIIGKVSQVTYEPKLQEIKYFLTQFILKVRSVPSDAVLIKQNWLEAYKFMRPQAAQILNDITDQDEANPLKKIGQETVGVQLISINQVAGDSSYQVRWSETVYGEAGAPSDRYTMSGVFTLEVETPSDEAVLVVNPLGIFIKNFHWTRELKNEGNRQ